MSDPLVSIVIPAYNPTSHLLEAIASAAAQTHPHTEIILVNDGSDEPESLKILENAAALVGTYLDQPNQGPSAARNAAFRVAAGDLVVPLDADDLLGSTYIATCLSALDAGHAFVYTDIRVFGTERYDEHLGGYNLYRLLERNYLSYAALIRKQEWERAAGYDEAMRLGYEDWEFWLRMGAHGAFGQHVSEPLFRYRKHGVTRSDIALAHHQELVDYIRQRHPELYEYKSRARIKARWSPAVSIIANRASREPVSNQTIEDIQVIAPGESPLSATVLNAMDGPLEPQAAEMAALAAWSGRSDLRMITPTGVAGSHLRRHLLNAGLLSPRSWARHPVRSLGRLIPLRAKEGINKLVGRSVFDLSFYLQFQPNSVLFGDTVIEPLVYFPKPAEDRRRVALVTTQLGPGGAEAVLYDIASTLCSGRFETLLFATQSRDDRWAAKWRERVTHVYDLAQAVPLDRMAAAIGSAVVNWRCNTLVLQNSLYGYAALPLIKRLLPSIQIIDVNHYLDEGWDQMAATSDVASYIDRRVALAESVRDRLLAMGTPASKIVLVRNGVDLERFVTSRMNSAGVKQILFAARLTPRKQPVLLADIARELCGLRPQRDFRFVIAGDGPEGDRVRGRVHKLGLDALFDFRGQVEDLAPLLVDCDVMILPSRSEGVPLVVLEALASARPVVASKVGAIPEVLDSTCGILVENLDSALAFAQAINSLLDQPELREGMGAAGRRKMEAKHDIRKTREAFSRLIDQGSSVSVASTSRSTAME
jgi:glycosyltransferase involved in cell wall biosynthesis